MTKSKLAMIVDVAMSRIRQLSIRQLGTFCTIVTALAMTVNFLVAYRSHSARPQIGGRLGWWAWADQGLYFKSAVAWSQGNLDPNQHWYLSGYPLLAAPFIKLMSVHAFVLPNLICLLASLWFFTRIA